MPAADQSFDLKLDTDLRELERMDAWVHRVAAQLRLRENLVEEIHLCLIEAVTNIIAYGGDSPDRAIALSIKGLEDFLTVQIRDGGQPFDPLSHQLPPKPSKLEDEGIGGYGIRIIRDFATSLSYERLENQNLLTLTFAR